MTQSITKTINLINSNHSNPKVNVQSPQNDETLLGVKYRYNSA